MTLTLPVLSAILLAVFLCPAIVLYFVAKWWREDAAKREDERRELFDRLFARDWEQWKAVDVAERTESPPPATEAEEYEIWKQRTNSQSPGIHNIGKIV